MTGICSLCDNYVQVFYAVPVGGAGMDDLKSTLGPIYDIGFKQAMQHKWIALDKSGGVHMIVRKVIVSITHLFLPQPGSPPMDGGYCVPFA